MKGKAFIVYTTEEGGLFKITSTANYAQVYQEAVETGRLRVPRGDWYPGSSESRWSIDVEPKFICLTFVDINHDFVLGRSRSAVAA